MLERQAGTDIRTDLRCQSLQILHLLAQVARKMGDGWRHRIVIESALPKCSSIELPLPTCLAGENAGPPEDVGGPHGYALFLEIVADRDHEQYEDLIRWIGGVFDPKGFDLNRLNRDWKPTRARRPRG